MMTVAMILLLVGFITTLYEVNHQLQGIKWKPCYKQACYLAVLILFGYLFYSCWFVFLIDMNVRFVTGRKVSRNGKSNEQVDFAVELINRGRATSLTKWKAVLTGPTVGSVRGEVLKINRGWIKILGSDKESATYIMPDCDLIFETSRAINSGDAVYGIVSFNFDIPGAPLPLSTTVTLQATDMLGRTIKSRPIAFLEVEKMPRDVFPCREKRP